MIVVAIYPVTRIFRAKIQSEMSNRNIEEDCFDELNVMFYKMPANRVIQQPAFCIRHPGKKGGEESHRTAQPPTLAAFPPWGIQKERVV